MDEEKQSSERLSDIPKVMPSQMAEKALVPRFSSSKHIPLLSTATMKYIPHCTASTNSLNEEEGV